jgi:acyl CoA:acetate/3-ketoacid CoA transferase beta subunit
MEKLKAYVVHSFKGGQHTILGVYLNNTVAQEHVDNLKCLYPTEDVYLGVYDIKDPLSDWFNFLYPQFSLKIGE